MNAKSSTAGRDSLRLVHTSDWHLGIELVHESRRCDHERAIDSIVETCREFAPDAIVHTGDLFDHARPGADDQALAVDALSRLSDIAPVVVVGGNHDNNTMLDKAWDPLAGLAGHGRLSFRGRPRRPEAGGIIPIAGRDGDRRLLVATVPFLSQHSFAVFDRPGETTAGYTAGIKRLHDVYDEWLEANVDPAVDTVVWAAHLLVGGALPAGSERRVDLGEDYATSATQIPPVSYAAFGHIHRAQPLPGTATGRYAGGLLHFRFDETRAGMPDKTFVLVEFPHNAAPKIELAPIDTGRPLVELTATLDELRAHANSVAGALVRVTVPLDGPVPNLMRNVIDALEGATVVEVIPLTAERAQATVAGTGDERATIEELLQIWLASQGPEIEGSWAGGISRLMIQSAVRRERATLPFEDLLDEDIAGNLARELAELGWIDLAREAAQADAVGTDSDANATDDGAQDAHEHTDVVDK